MVWILLACWRRYTNKHRQRRSEERASKHVLRSTRSKVELSIFSVFGNTTHNASTHAFVWWTMLIGRWLMCASKHHNWYQTSQKPITMSSPKPPIVICCHERFCSPAFFQKINWCDMSRNRAVSIFILVYFFCLSHIRYSLACHSWLEIH